MCPVTTTLFSRNTQRSDSAALGASVGSDSIGALVSKAAVHLGPRPFAPCSGLRLTQFVLVGLTARQSQLALESLPVSGSLLHRLGLALYRKAIESNVHFALFLAATCSAATARLSGDSSDSPTSRFIHQQELISRSRSVALRGDGLSQALVVHGSSGSALAADPRASCSGRIDTSLDRIHGSKIEAASQKSLNHVNDDDHRAGDADCSEHISPSQSNDSTRYLVKRAIGNLAGYCGRTHSAGPRNWLVLRGLSAKSNSSGNRNYAPRVRSLGTIALRLRAWSRKPVASRIGMLRAERRPS